MSDKREYIYTEKQLKYLCTAVSMVMLEKFNEKKQKKVVQEEIFMVIDSIPSEEWENAYYTIAIEQNGE